MHIMFLFQSSNQTTIVDKATKPTTELAPVNPTIKSTLVSTFGNTVFTAFAAAIAPTYHPSYVVAVYSANSKSFYAALVAAVEEPLYAALNESHGATNCATHQVAINAAVLST